MDAPTAFFFGLEKKPKEQKFFHKLKLSKLHTYSSETARVHF